MKRISSIDYLKTIGIIAVVFGHSIIPSPLVIWIFSFHMPLFFLITGAVASRNVEGMSFRQFIEIRIKPLIHAYVVFSIIGLGYFFSLTMIGQSPPDARISEKVIAILYGSGTIEEPLRLVPVVLWFFPALITGLICFFCVINLKPTLRHIGASIALISAIYLAKYKLIWEIESGLLAAVFIYIGFQLRFLLAKKPNPAISIPSGLVMMAGGAYLAFQGGGFDFRSSTFGILPLSFLSIACTAAGIYCIISNLPRIEFIEKISDATLVIFPLHTIAFNFIDSVFKRLFGSDILFSGLYNSLKCISVILILTFSAPLFLRLSGLAKRRPESPH